MSARRAIAIGIALLAVSLAACSGDDGTEASVDSLVGTPVVTSASSPKPAETRPTLAATAERQVAATSTPAPITAPQGIAATPAPQPTNTTAPAPTATQPPPTAVPPTATTKPASNCDPNYTGACIPPYPPDLDCTQIAAKNFKSIGSDPHKFDNDKDGIACES